MKKSVKFYKNTSVNWSRIQSQIISLLEQQGVKDTKFSTISSETAERGGLILEKGTHAIMVEFLKLTVLSDGVNGRVPKKDVKR